MQGKERLNTSLFSFQLLIPKGGLGWSTDVLLPVWIQDLSSGGGRVLGGRVCERGQARGVC